MEKDIDIKIPQGFLKEVDPSLDNQRREFIKKHYNPFTETMPKSAIIEYYEKLSCASWNERLREMFPFLVKESNWADHVPGYSNFVSEFMSTSREAKNTFTRGEAAFLADKCTLMCDMYKFAQLRNGPWIPDWDNGDEKKWGIHMHKGGLSVEICVNWNYRHVQSVFGIDFKTKEIATEALDIFKERIIELYAKAI